MEYIITSKNETAKGFSVVATKSVKDGVDNAKILQLTGLSAEEAAKYTIGGKIKIS